MNQEENLSFLPLLIRPWVVEDCPDPGESPCLAGGDTAVCSLPPPPLPAPSLSARQQKPDREGVVEQTKGCRNSRPTEVSAAGKLRHVHPTQLGVLHHRPAQPRERAHNTSSPHKSIVRLISLVSIKHSDTFRMEHKALLNSRAEQSQ